MPQKKAEMMENQIAAKRTPKEKVAALVFKSLLIIVASSKEEVSITLR